MRTSPEIAIVLALPFVPAPQVFSVYFSDAPCTSVHSVVILSKTALRTSCLTIHMTVMVI